jgi:flagellar motor component MotA
MNSQFGSMVFDYLRKFNLEVEVEGKKELKEFYRRYNLMIPMGTNFEEVYEVLAEMSSDIKKMEEDNKKAIAEKEAKKAEEEASVA